MANNIKFMQLTELKTHQIDEILVYSICEALYSIKAVIGKQYFTIKKGRKNYQARSIGQIYKDTHDCNIGTITLIQNSAYDEMIGQPVKDNPNTLSISSQVKAETRH